MRNVTSKLAAAFGVALGLWIAQTASAHHSMTGFDRKTTTMLVGTVKEFSWQNPHCWITLDVVGKDGKEVSWNVEMTAPGYLQRAGWKKTTIKVGDKVTVGANVLLTGEPGALFVSVTLPDGTTWSQRGLEPAGKGK